MIDSKTIDVYNITCKNGSTLKDLEDGVIFILLNDVFEELSLSFWLQRAR